MRVLTIFSWLLSMVFAGAAIAATENPRAEVEKGRLAIVIGNSNYQSDRYEDLLNAGNDARKLSETLRRLNFEVATGIDLTAAQTADLLARYEPKLNQYSAVLIFYAGHGVQFNGENFLLPVDSLDPQNVASLTERATRLNDVIARFASRDRQTFIFLDACRNNPLGAGAGTGNGLAQVEVGENAFIAFSTKPGFVTVDGAGSNSPFTEALLENVEIPGLSISDMMIRVRNETERLTLGRQVPWDQSNLREQFYFTEQQVLDSQELSATLNRILEVPAMKDKLLVQLASADNDLQSTVLMLGRQLPELSRSVEVPGARSGADAGAGQQVASLSQGDLDGSRKAVASDIQSLLVLGKSGETDGAPTFDLNHRLQTELARVGCYRSTIDGVWGSGSRRALGEYLRRTKQSQETLDPKVETLGDLFLRSGRICKEPVAVKPVKTATMSSGDGKDSKGRAAKATKGSSKGAKATGRAKPAAPPPDIGAGIGIGGVF